MKYLRNTAWLTAAGSLLLMIIGHSGTHHLSWIKHQLSSYAASAPHDNFITAAMIVAALSIALTGIVISQWHSPVNRIISQLLTLCAGAAVAGLLMLAYYEETARSLALLKKAGFRQIRIQSFHDAGLLIFFYASLIMIILAGLLALYSRSATVHRLLASIVMLLAPASYLLMTTAWPPLLGLEVSSAGLKQRAALLCLWLAMLFILLLAGKNKTYPLTATPTPSHADQG